MQSFRKLVVFKKVIKYFFIFTGLWIVLLLIVGLKYQSSNTTSYNGKRLYEVSLSNLRNWHIKGDVSRFRGKVTKYLKWLQVFLTLGVITFLFRNELITGWELLSYAHENLTKAERFNIIKYNDDPPGNYKRQKQ